MYPRPVPPSVLGSSWTGIRAVLSSSPSPDGCTLRSPRLVKGGKTRQLCVVNYFSPCHGEVREVVITVVPRVRNDVASVSPRMAQCSAPVVRCDFHSSDVRQCGVRVPLLKAVISVKRPVLCSLKRTVLAQHPALLMTGWAWEVTQSPVCRALTPGGAGH